MPQRRRRLAGRLVWPRWETLAVDIVFTVLHCSSSAVTRRLFSGDLPAQPWPRGLGGPRRSCDAPKLSPTDMPLTVPRNANGEPDPLLGGMTPQWCVLLTSDPDDLRALLAGTPEVNIRKV